MMANWDLNALARDLAELDLPVLLVAGEDDRAVSPDDADRLLRILPRARQLRLPGLGHLAHEEDPEEVARVVLQFMDACSSESTHGHQGRRLGT
jgi:magnesium chelatase accessory protein